MTVSLVGALLALDRTAVLQVMVSRPIVAAPLIAALLGDPVTGIKVGIILELLWIHCLPVGASIPPDETIVSVLVTAITVWNMRFLGAGSEAVISLTLILVIPAAVLAQRMDSHIRKLNIRSARAADAAVEKLDLKGLRAACLMGVRRFYIAYALIFLVLLSVGTLAVYLVYPLLSENLLRGLKIFYYALPILGVASVLSMARIRNPLSVFLASFAAFSGLIEVIKW